MPNPKKPRPKCTRADCSSETKRPNDKYCSIACQQEHRYETYVTRWLAGEIDGSKWVVEVSGFVRRYIKRTKGEQCETCGWAERNPHTGRIPLHLDHIDGDWRNNRPENLRLLCPNHHALTSSYGSQNRGKGRPYVVQKRTPTPAKDAEVGVQASRANLAGEYPKGDG